MSSMYRCFHILNKSIYLSFPLWFMLWGLSQGYKQDCQHFSKHLKFLFFILNYVIWLESIDTLNLSPLLQYHLWHIYVWICLLISFLFHWFICLSLINITVLITTTFNVVLSNRGSTSSSTFSWKILAICCNKNFKISFYIYIKNVIFLCGLNELERIGNFIIPSTLLQVLLQWF